MWLGGNIVVSGGSNVVTGGVCGGGCMPFTYLSVLIGRAQT